jgi:hypothetical protein
MLRAVGDGFLFPRKKRTPQKNDKEHALLVLSRADTCCLLYLLSTSNLQCITTNLLTATATQVLTRVEMFAKFKFETQCSQSSYFQTFQHSGTGDTGNRPASRINFLGNYTCRSTQCSRDCCVRLEGHHTKPGFCESSKKVPDKIA